MELKGHGSSCEKIYWTYRESNKWNWKINDVLASSSLDASVESNKWNWKLMNQLLYEKCKSEKGIQQMELKELWLQVWIWAWGNPEESNKWNWKYLLHVICYTAVCVYCGIQQMELKAFNLWSPENSTTLMNPTNGIESITNCLLSSKASSRRESNKWNWKSKI